MKWYSILFLQSQFIPFRTVSWAFFLITRCEILHHQFLAGWNLINHGMSTIYQLVIRILQPSTVSLWSMWNPEDHQSLHRSWWYNDIILWFMVFLKIYLSLSIYIYIYTYIYINLYIYMIIHDLCDIDIIWIGMILG